MPRGNVTQSHTSRMRFQISDFWVMYLPRPRCLEEAGLVCAVVLLKTPSDLQKPPTALTVKSGEQRVGVQGIASGGNPSPIPSQLVPPARHSTHGHQQDTQPMDAQCFQVNVMMPNALTSWSCSN